MLRNSERIQQPRTSFSTKVLLEFDRLFEVQLMIIPELKNKDLVLDQIAK